MKNRGACGCCHARLVEQSRCAAIPSGGIERVEATCQARSCYEKKMTRSLQPLGITPSPGSSNSKDSRSVPA
jgi:hypothetical protein